MPEAASAVLEGRFVIILSSQGPENVVTGRLADELRQRRQEHLVHELILLLDRHRTVVVSTAVVDDVDGWRKAARAAGRQLGITVRTGVSPDGGRVWVTEGP